jgi:hypothetical protein
MRDSYREVIHISGEGHHDRSSNALLEHATELALGIDLSTEGGHAEVVLGTEGGDALLGRATHHGGARINGKGHVNTSLNLLTQTLPVGSVESTLSLQLGAGNPVLRLIATNVRDSGIRALGKAGALPNGLKTEGELRGDGLKILANEDTGQATLKKRRVKGLDSCSEIGAAVFVFELGHILTGSTRSDLEAGLGGERRGPSVVESSRKVALVIDVTLGKHLKQFY